METDQQTISRRPPDNRHLRNESSQGENERNRGRPNTLDWLCSTFVRWRSRYFHYLPRWGHVQGSKRDHQTVGSCWTKKNHQVNREISATLFFDGQWSWSWPVREDKTLEPRRCWVAKRLSNAVLERNFWFPFRWWCSWWLRWVGAVQERSSNWQCASQDDRSCNSIGSHQSHRGTANRANIPNQLLDAIFVRHGRRN